MATKQKWALPFRRGRINVEDIGYHPYYLQHDIGFSGKKVYRPVERRTDTTGYVLGGNYGMTRKEAVDEIKRLAAGGSKRNPMVIKRKQLRYSPTFTNASINRKHAITLMQAGVSGREIAAEWPRIWKVDSEGKIGQRYDSEIADGSNRLETSATMTSDSVKKFLREWKARNKTTASNPASIQRGKWIPAQVMVTPGGKIVAKVAASKVGVSKGKR